MSDDRPLAAEEDLEAFRERIRSHQAEYMRRWADWKLGDPPR